LAEPLSVVLPGMPSSVAVVFWAYLVSRLIPLSPLPLTLRSVEELPSEADSSEYWVVIPSLTPLTVFLKARALPVLSMELVWVVPPLSMVMPPLKVGASLSSF
jgi:hypothetical protein